METFRRYNSQYNKFSNTEESALYFKGNKQAKLYMSIDGSSTNTGIAIIDDTSRSLIGTVAVSENTGEDYIQYKVRFKRLIMRLMDNNIDVLKGIYYEEPFVGFTSATKVLMTLRTTVREIQLENAPKYDHIAFTEVNNQKWKKIFLQPEKVPAKTEAQKEYVKRKVAAMFGDMATRIGYDKKTHTNFSELVFTEDECDAIGLGIACMTVRLSGYDEDELLSKKKARPFKYNVKFDLVHAESMEEAEQFVLMNFEKYNEKFKIPDKVVSNGITIVPLNGRGAFDSHVFSNMGQDDRLLIMEFQAGKYVDVIIKNERVDLCSTKYDDEDFMIAFVWRQSRR